MEDIKFGQRDEAKVDTSVSQIDRTEAIEAVSSVSPVVPIDAGYDTGYADGLAAGREAGHAAGVRDAMKLAALERTEVLEAAEAKHAKALEALTSRHARVTAATAARHAAVVQGAEDKTADALSDTAEAEIEADASYLVAVQDVLMILDERIDRGHADGRLEAVEIRSTIATAFGVV